MKSEVKRPLAGLATILAILAIVFGAVVMFRGGITTTVPMTVMSPRAGLVMNPDAKVKLLGVPVGRVASIEDLPDGRAAIHLEMDPSQLAQIPENIRIEIASPTVFGAKSVELIPPSAPSTVKVRPGQVLDARNVTVEFNTVFERLSEVLSKIQPEKLNETLGAISTALDGRGRQLGQALSDFDKLLVKIEPSLPDLSHDIEVAPVVLNAYADAAIPRAFSKVLSCYQSCDSGVLFQGVHRWWRRRRSSWRFSNRGATSHFKWPYVWPISHSSETDAARTAATPLGGAEAGRRWAWPMVALWTRAETFGSHLFSRTGSWQSRLRACHGRRRGYRRDGVELAHKCRVGRRTPARCLHHAEPYFRQLPASMGRGTPVM